MGIRFELDELCSYGVGLIKTRAFGWWARENPANVEIVQYAFGLTTSGNGTVDDEDVSSADVSVEDPMRVPYVGVSLDDTR